MQKSSYPDRDSIWLLPAKRMWVNWDVTFWDEMVKSWVLSPLGQKLAIFLVKGSSFFSLHSLYYNYSTLPS